MKTQLPATSPDLAVECLKFLYSCLFSFGGWNVCASTQSTCMCLCMRPSRAPSVQSHAPLIDEVIFPFKNRSQQNLKRNYAF